MKYWQAVYQTDAHGFNIVYSKNIWKTVAEAELYLDELQNIFGAEYISQRWVTELFVDDYGDNND